MTTIERMHRELEEQAQQISRLADEIVAASGYSAAVRKKIDALIFLAGSNAQLEQLLDETVADELNSAV